MANVVRYLNKKLVINYPSFLQINSRAVTSILAQLKEEDNSTVDKKTLAVHNIETILNVHVKTALKVVNENRKLINTGPSVLGENYEILLENGLNTSVVLRYPHLLWSTHLAHKIEKIKKLPYPLKVTIVLAGLPKNMIDSVVRDRITLLADLFEISPRETCEFLYKRTFLVTQNLDILKENMSFIREFGISLEDLRKDPWVLRYSREVITERIKYIRDTEVQPLTPKPWMLRSPMDVIENHFRRRQSNRQILGSASLTEYLSNRLKCTEEEAKYLVSKLPALRTKSLRTVSDIITFLYSKGFQPYHIYRVPKILVHSVETTKKRLEQMENAGIKVDSLYMLTKSHKQFKQNFDAMVKMIKGMSTSNKL